MVDLERVDETHSNLICKVTDFGFAKAMDPDQLETLSLGTPLYMSPELAKRKPYDAKVDIWALGVLTHIILTGNPPWTGKSKDQVFKAICYDTLDLEPFSKYYQ